MINKGSAVKASLLLAAVLIFSGWSLPASSAGDDCAGDIARFCSPSPADSGNVASCLKRHENELSPLCRDTLQSVQRKIEEVKLACRADIDNLCKAIEPGRGRIAECLNGHASELSPGCAEQMRWLNARLNGR